MMDLRQQIRTDLLPQHIAVIMDGNGRWAKSRGMQRLNGHQNAIKAVRDTVEACTELGVKFLTLYTFSTENWNRPQAEVSGLMELLSATIDSETETLQFTFGTLPSLSYTAKSIPNVTAVGSVPSLSYTSRTIPNISVTSTTVATGITAS